MKCVLSQEDVNTVKLYISIMILLDTYKYRLSAFGSAHPVTGLPETCFIFEEVVP